MFLVLLRPCSRPRPWPRSPRTCRNADELVPEEELLAARGPEFPDAPLLRRHPRAHRRIDGRGRLRRPPRTRRCLPLRARRRGHGFERHARQACHARSISSWWPITPTTWAFSQAVRRRPSYLADPTGKKWYDDIQKGGEAAVAVATDVIDRFSKNTFPPALASLPGTKTYRDAWEVTINAAEKYNKPSQFTAFIGFEWTSNTGGNNLHRVVIFRDGGDKAGQVEPLRDDPPERQRRSEGPLEIPAGLRGQDRRRDPRDRAQRQPLERDHVPGDRLLHRQAHHEGVRRDARALGAAVRSHPDQGRRRSASRICRRPTSWPATRSGTSST